MTVSSRFSRSFPVLSLTAACMLAFAACSSSNNGGGTGGSSGSGTGGSNTGTGGSNTGTGGGTGGSNTGSGGTVATGGTKGTGGSNTGTGGSNTGTGGTNTGTGGTTGTGGFNNGGQGGTAGSGGTSTGTGGSNGGGGSGSGACPANATFCSGFETNALPTGAIYNANAAPGDWTRDFAVDTTQHHSGSSSLRVKSNGSIADPGATGAYQMLAVPATPTAFWARFWIQSSLQIGYVDAQNQAPHNAYAGASVGAGTNDVMIEFAEDSGIAFNTKDQDCWPTIGCTGQHPTNFYTLPAMTWECIELSFDATRQVQQLYVNGTLQINAPNYPGSTVAPSLPYFKFGFDAYHGPPRQIWYDDVVVAPTRIGCQ